MSMPHDFSESDRPAVPPGTIDLPLNSSAPTAFGSGGAAGGPGRGPAGYGEGEPPPPQRLMGHRRQRVVTVGIIVTTALSLLATSLLYYRWAKRPDPEAIIVVWAGDEKAWDGATVTVRGSGLASPLKYVLRAEENLIVRFHVPPGGYVVRVEGKDGRLLAERQTPPQRPLTSRLIWWPFRAPPAATQLGMQ